MGGTGARRVLAPWRFARAGLVLAALSVLLSVPGSARDLGVGDGLDLQAARSIIALTNAARGKHSLPALSVDSLLTLSAERYAEAIAREEPFDHTDADGSTFIDRTEAAGYLSWSFLGENLATGIGPADPAAMLTAWMNSPGHRRNLLSTELQEVGVGCYVRSVPNSRYWCVQEFGTKRQRAGL